MHFFGHFWPPCANQANLRHKNMSLPGKKKKKIVIFFLVSKPEKKRILSRYHLSLRCQESKFFNRMHIRIQGLPLFSFLSVYTHTYSHRFFYISFLEKNILFSFKLSKIIWPWAKTQQDKFQYKQMKFGKALSNWKLCLIMEKLW